MLNLIDAQRRPVPVQLTPHGGVGRLDRSGLAGWRVLKLDFGSGSAAWCGMQAEGAVVGGDVAQQGGDSVGYNGYNQDHEFFGYRQSI